MPGQQGLGSRIIIERLVEDGVCCLQHHQPTGEGGREEGGREGGREEGGREKGRGERREEGREGERREEERGGRERGRGRREGGERESDQGTLSTCPLCRSRQGMRESQGSLKRT